MSGCNNLVRSGYKQVFGAKLDASLRTSAT
jgi:hypothetical protein